MSKSKKDELIEKIEKDLIEEAVIKSNASREANDAKTSERKEFIRRLQYERREAGLDGVVLKAQEVARIQANELVQEERLAVELGLIHQQEIKEEKLRQHLRENSHELKELENQLKAAYVNKILAAQIAENEAKKVHEQMLEQKSREAMLNALGSQAEIERRARLFEKQMKEEYRRSLQDQIIEKERIRQEEYIAFIQESKLSEDTMKKIRDEEENEKVQKHLMKQKVKEEMEQFHTARELWKARERILIDKENQKLEAIVKVKEQIEAERNNKKSSNEEERERIREMMTKEILAKNKLREERLELIQVIMENEIKSKERMKEKEELTRALTQKHEAKAEFQKILEEKNRVIKEEKDLNARFAEQMNLRVVEELRKEKEKEEHKRQIRVNDRKYNEEKIKNNIQKRAESLKLTQLANQVEEKEAKKRAEMIEEERIRILKEHAPHLSGYFPKGCLKAKDLEVLGLAGYSNSDISKSSCSK